MTARRLTTILLLVSLPLGCKEPPADAPAESKAEAEGGEAGAKAEGGEAGAKAEGGEAGQAKAEGGDPSQAGASQCPTSLTGRETTDRVITKECGVVTVTGNYTIDGVSLALEPGATLAFAEGAKLSVGNTKPSKLVVNGTATEPVTFTTSGDKVAGVWEGVWLYENADRSTLEGLVLEYAGKTKAALHIEAEEVSIAGTTVREAKAEAIEVTRDGSITMVGSTLHKVGPIAMVVTPAAAAGIQPGNTFPADARVQVAAGQLETDATWNAIGTPWLLAGRVQVKGEAGRRATLTLAAGAELRFDADGTIDVGYVEQGGLKAVGTAGQPIVMAAHERQEPGGWSGLRIMGKGEATLQHVTLRHGGRKDGEGTLLVDDSARVSLQDVTFEQDAVGVVVRGKKAELEAFDRVSFTSTPIAMKLSARYLGSLGAANVYEGDARIVVEADKLEQDATFTAQNGARVELDGRLQVSGATLTMTAGSTLWIKDGVEVQVGNYDTAALVLEGTAEAPITFRGQRDEPGTWGGVVLYGKAKGNVLRNVVLRNAGGQAGVRLDGEAEATVETLRCDSCTTPTLKWGCKATLTQSGVEAGEGTPMATETPECK